MKYTVEIRDTGYKTVNIEADSPEEAEEIAEARYSNGQIVLDPNKHYELSFNVL